MADIMVQMKMPAETKAIDKYLLAEYLQKEDEAINNLFLCDDYRHGFMCNARGGRDTFSSG